MSGNLNKRRHSGNLTLLDQRAQFRHRAGWPWVIDQLNAIVGDDGVLLDDFCDINFRYPHEVSKGRWEYLPPYNAPWIAMLHNPPGVPNWWRNFKQSANYSCEELFKLPLWVHSMPYLRGIFCFSDYHTRTLENVVGVPVKKLFHPAPVARRLFCMEEFMGNSKKRLVQIGWWLRRMQSIYRVKAAQFVKSRIDPEQPIVYSYIEEEKKNTEVILKEGEVEILNFLSNDEYDDLLAKNIVFLDLYDASANNTVLECIMRNTPILINRIGGVPEYLGEEYPFYYQSFIEAAEKLKSMELIAEVHQYLRELPIKRNLSADHFRRSIVESGFC